MFFGNDNSLMGVDIGSSSMKLVQLDRTKEPTLMTYGIVDIPESVGSQTTDEEIKKVAALLTNLMTAAKVTTKRCVISLPNSSVFTSVIDMPKMNDREMDSAMQFEAKKYIPLPFSEVTLSWVIIADNDDNSTCKVLLIAVPNQIREIYIKLFNYAGLNLESIEIEALSLIRALSFDQNQNDVIIDIGAKVTGINVVRNGTLQLTRNLTIGGDTITERIAQALNLSLPRAEQFKRDFGLQKTDFLPEAVKPVLTLIKNELSQIADQYKMHDVTLDRITFVGGGAQLPGITEYFTAETGIPSQLSDPLAKIRYNESIRPVLSRFSQHLAVATGLALRHEGN